LKWIFEEKFKFLFLAVLAAVTVFVWYAVFAESQSGILVAFLDVGEGDAVFVRAPAAIRSLWTGEPEKRFWGIVRSYAVLRPDH